MSDLKTCPWCGGHPTFTTAMEKDDRRYMQMDLECCVTMSSSISYGTFHDMSEQDIKETLRAALTKEWNTRFSSDTHDELRDRIGQAINDAIATGATNADYCDSREIDRLADAVMSVLASESDPTVTRIPAAPVAAEPESAVVKSLRKMVEAYGPKSLQYDIEHPNDGLNSNDPKEVERVGRGTADTTNGSVEDIIKKTDVTITMNDGEDRKVVIMWRENVGNTIHLSGYIEEPTQPEPKIGEVVYVRQVDLDSYPRSGRGFIASHTKEDEWNVPMYLARR